MHYRNKFCLIIKNGTRFPYHDHSCVGKKRGNHNLGISGIVSCLYLQIISTNYSDNNKYFKINEHFNKLNNFPNKLLK